MSFKIREKRDRNERLCDFLYHLGAGKTDQRILTSWKEWFTLSCVMVLSLMNFVHAKVSVPWAVTLIHGNHVLWKIDETLDDAGIRKERGNPDVRWFMEQ